MLAAQPGTGQSALAALAHSDRRRLRALGRGLTQSLQFSPRRPRRGGNLQEADGRPSPGLGFHLRHPAVQATSPTTAPNSALASLSRPAGTAPSTTSGQAVLYAPGHARPQCSWASPAVVAAALPVPSGGGRRAFFQVHQPAGHAPHARIAGGPVAETAMISCWSRGRAARTIC